MLVVIVTAAACGISNDDADPGDTVAATSSPTPAPRDTEAAISALQSFVSAVEDERIEDAWALYAASVPGTTGEYRSDRGCDFNVFSFEFPSMRYLFQQLAPLEVVQTFGSALGLSVVELRVGGANGVQYLATLARAEPYSQDYQVWYLNSGNPAVVPGAPDPFPSPQYPQGSCGIWTGAR
jgi:hypothetical protein